MKRGCEREASIKFVHGLDVGDGLVGIDSSNRRAHARSDALGRDGGTNQQIHVAPGQLREREIELRLRLLVEAFVLHVGGFSDDLSRIGPAADENAFADRIFVWPELPREGLVDEHYLRRLRVIGVSECASGEQGHAHGLEPLRADGLDIDEGALGERGVRLSFGQDRSDTFPT